MKLIILIIVFILTTSCASKVCGGSGGKRCVDISQKSNPKIIS
jgi:hypothetical protein